MGEEQDLESPADPKAAAKVFIVQNEQGNKLKERRGTSQGDRDNSWKQKLDKTLKIRR